MKIPTFKTILYATDLSKKMRPAFRHAISLAQQYQAKIIMLHVAEPIGNTGMAVLELYVPDMSDDFEQEELRGILNQMEKRLEDFYTEELGKDSDLVSDVAVVTGRPAEEIKKYAATHDVDLIVMGTHTSSSFGSSLLGSTARKLINISDRPVLVVPVGK
ncbi:universal stress protein [Sedimenticola selenatireducens]|uniref:Universal stress protein n=1 Tax=Sedimenticola selenatireducens TaxID=191960 RepID=A0A2N6CU66_9GAMM|nr:universal stress protein [Sedimenticola selenatireducens]PLX60706.1 MAG: universal stress protein [Sedimenticola selenatireducens]